MDRVGANFYRCLSMIEDRLGAIPLVLQLPVGAEADFLGVVDVLNMKEIIWQQDTLGAEFKINELSDEYRQKAEEYRKKLVELAVEQDDEIMERYLDGKEPSLDELKKCIRKGTISGAFCSCALWHCF